MSLTILDAKRLGWPTDWAELFGREAPLALEIGFGGGQFLIDWAQKHPEFNVVGVEISLPSLRRGASKISHLGLRNGLVMHGSAETVLWALSTPEMWEAVFINCPDPWPKSGQLHRRLINGRFLHLLATRLSKSATLDIATDHADYAAWITEALEASPYLQSRLPTTFLNEDPDRFQTKYELLGIEKGHICHYYKWERNDAPLPDPFPLPKEHSMPHAVLRSPLTLEEMNGRFTKTAVVQDETIIKLLDAFLAAAGDRLLVEAYINEMPLRQRIGLLVRQRSEGEFVVGLHEIGFPRPTTGVQHAVAAVARWLLSLDEQSAIVTTNLPMLKQLPEGGSTE